MELRTGRHYVFILHVYLVFTKYRKAELTNDMLISMKPYMGKICANFECTLEEFNGEKNHVHILVSYLQKVSISKLVNSLKGVSSRRLRGNYEKELDKVCWKRELWSTSYFMGGAQLSVLKKYIKQQNRPQ